MKIPRTLKFTGKDPSIKGYEKQKLLTRLEKLIREETPNTINDSMMQKVPNIIIGSYNYPNINTGFLSSNNVQDEDNPKEWSENLKINIKDIILKRQSLTNSRFKTDIKNPRFQDKIKEVSLSQKSLDAEIFINGTMKREFNLNNDLLPHGPVSELKKIDILENAKIPFHVQRAESDSDLKAHEAIETLNKKGIDEHFLTKIVSAGNLGLRTQRKIVPTKWSITMIDDTLGKKYIKQIESQEMHDASFFYGNYLGNHYYCLIIPGPWSFELFETYTEGLKNTSEYASARDYETSHGRATYAKNTSGGYYASRIAALEYLIRVKKRGRVIMFRFITDEYWAPLGVWVVREAARKAFKKEPRRFETKEELIKYSFIQALKEFKININPLIRGSKIIKEANTQRTLI
jgi:hypothetical protein